MSLTDYRRKRSFDKTREPEPGKAVPKGQRAIFVELGRATFGTMREVGHYYGSLTAAQKFSVAPKVGGEVKKLLVDIGDHGIVLHDQHIDLGHQNTSFRQGSAEEDTGSETVNSVKFPVS